ncbi:MULTISPECIES: hypothetical protein [Gordonia]|uniref:Uncharacterized protein n=1 Tax=Gordonia amicalis TaxID=89053 RepID=A0AAE4R637_9ACTN|nr:MULTISPECIES: hypothetical protein [Gordonia]MCZ0915097.1 hypothetical protein [Gordonia amicalis]MDJ0455294.1 hypothetical protein [Gordonia amicalis]MDV6309014.1 hypothetical protein [Gordonia amicalis]MDV6312667.1 hypothetical protein [Gordonia amicalis]MDV7078425.1 hypothetical protein [Gordonia amicalis]
MAAEQGGLAGLVEPSSPLVPILSAAGRRFLRPLHVQVVGRPGVGRDTMARALRERLALTVIGPGEDARAAADADLWVLVLAGPPRRADHELLRSLPADRVVVVLGKADTHPDWDAAVDAANRSSTQLGLPVHAVSQLLACADLDATEFTALARLAAEGAEMPSMAGRFLVGAPGSEERILRQGLLRRIDAFGIDTALRLIAEGSDMAADASALNRALHAISGVPQLTTEISDRVGRVRFWREVEIRAELERAAAGGCDRENAERLLAAGGLG